MAFSEFGRRVAENTSLGTDHGTAGPAFILGKPIAGGHYGGVPSLTDLMMATCAIPPISDASMPPDSSWMVGRRRPRQS